MRSDNIETKIAHTEGLGWRNTSYFHTRKLYYNLGRQIKTSSFFCEKTKMSSSNSHSSVSSNSSISIPCEIEDELVETESKTEFEVMAAMWTLTKRHT